MTEMDSCTALLSAGTYRGDMVWQPPGCMLHNYSQLDLINCLRYRGSLGQRNHFVFSGDSRVREYHNSFLNHLDPKEYPTNFLDVSIRKPYVNAKNRYRVDYFWSPFAHESMIENLHIWKKESHQPTMLVAGNGLWDVLRLPYSDHELPSYFIHLGQLVQAFNSTLDNKTIILWKLQEIVSPHRLEHVDWMMTNKRIDIYNEAALEVMQYSAAKIWSSNQLILKGNPDDSVDGKHNGPMTLKTDSQILYNLYCNKHMDFIDGTCCSHADGYYATPSLLQIITYSMLGLCSVIGSIMLFWKQVKLSRGKISIIFTPLNEQSKQEVASDLYILMMSLAKLGVIMSYFYLCDRTKFFIPENKHYSKMSFFLPIGFLFALGLFFNKESKYPTVLNRDQADEWKGWMQLVILIYGVTGASKIVPIYMYIRTLVSAYVFLSGYSHFCYFWHDGKADLFRVFKVLFRLNFMTVMMCLCMNRPYHFYYLVPLISIWYLIAYIVLATPPRITVSTSNNSLMQYLLFALKFAVINTLITVVFSSKRIFDALFGTGLLKALFATTDGDVYEWWFRWKLHQFSMFYGVMFASTFLVIQTLNITKYITLVSRCIVSTAELIVQSIYAMATRIVCKMYATAVLIAQRVYSMAMRIIGKKYPIAMLIVERICSISTRIVCKKYPTAVYFAQRIYSMTIIISNKIVSWVWNVAVQIIRRLNCTNTSVFLTYFYTLVRTVTAIVAMRWYILLTNLCSDKANCNEIHSYIVFVPILSYIVLRNTFLVIRHRYSAFFAWFGRISLELFVGQYHIWLAVDSHGVLVLIPGYPVLNTMITSFIFVCVAHEIHEITAAILHIAVPNTWKTLLRIVFVFTLLFLLLISLRNVGN